MKALQLIRRGAFPPDVLKVIFEAFDHVWTEVSTDVSIRASAVETARLSLATIVLSLAAQAPVERGALKAAAVEAFRQRHRIG